MFQLYKSLWRISSSIETSLFRGMGGKKGVRKGLNYLSDYGKALHNSHHTLKKKILRSWARFHRSLKHCEFMKNEFNRQSSDQEELFYITKKFLATLLNHCLKDQFISKDWLPALEVIRDTWSKKSLYQAQCLPAVAAVVLQVQCLQTFYLFVFLFLSKCSHKMAAKPVIDRKWQDW